MPVPATRDVWQEQRTKCVAPLDCFSVRFGYKDRDSIQLRLEPDGSVFLFDDREARPLGEDKVLMAQIPFDLLAAEWPRFVVYLRAKAAEAAEGVSDE